MKILAYQQFQKCYQRLPGHIQKKIDKQIQIMSHNLFHPSLHTKKIKGTEGIWEARVDIQYRMTFEFAGDTIFLRVAGNHDEVLKNP